MARCQCAGSASACGCLVTGGNGVSVSGTGSANSPYIVDGSPNFYNIESIDTADPPVWLNRNPDTLVGNRAVFLLDVNANQEVDIYMPDGSINAPEPALGAMIEIYVRGGTTAGATIVNWQGGIITWFGPAPTTTPVGWYRFTFAGYGFLGQYTPLR